MTIDRDKFLSALVALTLSGAGAACGGETPPAAAEEPAPQQTAGAEQPAPAAEPPAAAPAPAPAAEPVPEVQQAGPTHE